MGVIINSFLVLSDLYIINIKRKSKVDLMTHGESDTEKQIRIQCIHLSPFWNYFWKRQGSFKSINPFFWPFRIH